MKRFALVGAAATLLSLGLFGCSNTADGAGKDVVQDGQKAASVANDAANATKNAADKVGDATKQAADATVDATKKAASDVGDATKKAAVATADATKDAANATVDGTKKVAVAMADATKDAGKNATGALEVTPKVKLAIVADKDLNDTHNKINVNTKDGVVHLVGTVANGSMKKKATAVATKALKDLNATDTVSNELTVGAP